MKKRIGGILVCMLVIGAGIAITQASKTDDMNTSISGLVPVIDRVDQMQTESKSDLDTPGDGHYGIGPNAQCAQSFTPTTSILTRIKLAVAKTMDGLDFNLVVSIRAKINGPDLVSIVIPSSKVPNIEHPRRGLLEVDIPDISVSQGETYYIVCSSTNGSSAGAYVWYAVDRSAMLNDGSATMVYDLATPYSFGFAWYKASSPHGDNQWHSVDRNYQQDTDFIFVTFGR